VHGPGKELTYTGASVGIHPRVHDLLVHAATFSELSVWSGLISQITTSRVDVHLNRYYFTSYSPYFTFFSAFALISVREIYAL